ncbi:MAG: putative phage abortive infection protein [Bacteroidota bacterium]
MEFEKIKQQLKERIALGLNYGFQSLESSLKKDSLFSNELMGLKGQFNDLNRIANQGLLAYDQVEIGFNKIRLALLEIIDKLSENDLSIVEGVPKPYNNELQVRKQNFFQLLNIHFENLENFTLMIFSGQDRKVQRSGRMGVTELYTEFFAYNFREETQKNGGLPIDIKAFCTDFFQYPRPQLEVYMKTVQFILGYIMDEELDQDFFLGIFRSVLSRKELSFIFYYSLSGELTNFRETLQESGLFPEGFAEHLLEPEHFELLAA